MVTPDPERPGKRHLSYRQSIVLLAAILLVAAITLAPWAVPSLPYR
jgi:hypothetical protein